MSNQKWAFESGSGGFYEESTNDVYSVKYRNGEVSFNSSKLAKEFYDSIEPEGSPDSKALWQLKHGFMGELIESHSS